MRSHPHLCFLLSIGEERAGYSRTGSNPPTVVCSISEITRELLGKHEERETKKGGHTQKIEKKVGGGSTFALIDSIRHCDRVKSYKIVHPYTHQLSLFLFLLNII